MTEPSRFLINSLYITSVHRLGRYATIMVMIVVGLMCGGLVVGLPVNDERVKSEVERAGTEVERAGLRVKREGPEAEREEFGSEPATHDLEQSLKYLEKFGYIDDRPGAYRTEEEYRRAIISLQAMAKLPETGVIDDATWDRMKQPRCGITDIPATGPVDPNDPLQYELGPSKWGTTSLTYRVLRDRLTRDLSENAVRQDLRGAMDLWERVSTLRFTDADTVRSSSGEADILISFETYDHGDGSVFDGQGKVLAHAFSPGAGRGGDVHFDDGETWSSQSTSGTNLLIVAAHELGHSLGLAHSREKGSLMYPWYAGYKQDYQLHTDDILGIQHLYGGPGAATTTSRMVTINPTATTAPTGSSNPHRLETCGQLNAVAVIRGEIFAFYGKWFWRMTADGMITSGPYKLQEFWYGLPTHVERIDAAFERPENGRIVFFSGRFYYEFDGNKIIPEYSPRGRPLSDLGLSSDVSQIDAVLVWGYNRRVYLFSGERYWRVSIGGQRMTIDYGYPYSVVRVWRGVPFPIDAAFTNKDGLTYFIKDTRYWLYNDNQSKAVSGYPQPIHQLWHHCRHSSFRSSGTSSVTSSSSILLLAVICVTVTLKQTLLDALF